MASGIFPEGVVTFPTFSPGDLIAADQTNRQDAEIVALETYVLELPDRPSAICATAGTALPAYSYNNESGGVGATITFSSAGSVSIDGHTLALNDVVVVKDETGANEPFNGLYLVTTAPASLVQGVLTRHIAMNTSTQFPGACVFVTGGSTNVLSTWTCTVPSPPTVGSNNITFAQSTLSPEDIQNSIATFANDTGSANTYQVSLEPAVTAYTEGLQVAFRAQNANTGASTLAINGLAAEALVKNGSTPLAAGDIQANQILLTMFDGINFQILAVNSLSLPLSIAEGGTGATTSGSALTVFGAAASGVNNDITSLTGLSTPLPLSEGGTGATLASGARSNLSAAELGSNGDITSLSGLTTPLSVGQGGTGATSASGARSNLSAAELGSNGDITSLTGLTTPLSVGQGGTGATSASVARSNLSAAELGANGDITSLTGLTTPLSVGQGGTGATSASVARSNLSAAELGANGDITSLTGLTTPLSVGQGGTGATSASGARSNLSAAESGANGDITSLTGLTTPLSAGQGGTGQSSYTKGNLLVASGSTTLSLEAVGSNGLVLTADSTQTTGVSWTSALPSGTVLPYAGLTVPSGFLLCDGSAVSRTTFATLLGAIGISTTGNTTNGSEVISSIPSTTGMAVGMPISGTGIPSATTISSVDSGTQIHISNNATATHTGAALVVAPYGIGDGSTTFNVPDARGRTPIGAGTGSGLTNRVLGVTGGEETHILATSEMPSHTHSITGINGVAVGGTVAESSGGSAVMATNATGGGGSHNNMQPFAVVRCIIKT